MSRKPAKQEDSKNIHYISLYLLMPVIFQISVEHFWYSIKRSCSIRKWIPSISRWTETEGRSFHHQYVTGFILSALTGSLQGHINDLENTWDTHGPSWYNGALFSSPLSNNIRILSNEMLDVSPNDFYRNTSGRP